ncbi:Stk1 family PASTA domain-containing Ser/Thr kinase [Streptomyces apocyni]|uniref:Stk1 family PASTA domain-containing Ser/Thr kinase n=1 Tax=Streptomyces apocyni TaxID=2654677 RepID=UPI0012EA8C64|nr:Stk1 family PASTA domain-containing Ser/Thr kinase [Streptomyces apocyni]
MEEPRRLGGRYELGQVLGRGGMAEVYLAHDTRLGRTVAVKTLRVDLARDESFQARFRREAQSAASLNHPAIVAVYDTGEDMVYDSASGAGAGISIPYIVMEYVDGSTLRELLHSGRKLLPERAMEMTIGILQALEYSHRAGIVHRDIKPANVMLTRNGQVKVMDFGIARAMGDSGMTMTQTSAVIGTAQYLSPEQAKGEQVDARSDLYSTGCLLYELLTVRPPFVGDSPVAVAYQHVREEAQPPSTFDPEITPDMDAIVLKALVKEPEYRYQSADEMRADIEASLDGQPVAATAAIGAVGYGGHPDSQQTAMLPPQHAHAQQATSMLPPVNPDDGGYGYDDQPGRRQPKKSGGASTALLIAAAVLVLAGAVAIGMYVFGGDGNKGDGKVTVPNFVGEEFDAAQRQAVNADVKLVRTDKPCEKQDEGNVCSQSPESGAEIEKGGPVEVVVSTGLPQVAVPSVVGETQEDAKAKLEGDEYGFTVTIEKEESTTVTAGEVLRQDPESGTKLEKGSEITLTVATAKPVVTVPALLGLTPEQAKAKLDEKGLVMGSQTEEESEAQPEGKVFEQLPAGGTDVDPGSTITIKIAKAPEEEEEEPDDGKFPMPKITGMTLGQAKQVLAQNNLQVGGINGSQDDASFVLRSNPKEGDEVKPGQRINLRTIGGQQDGGQQDGGQSGGQQDGGQDGGGGFIGGVGG